MFQIVSLPRSEIMVHDKSVKSIIIIEILQALHADLILAGITQLVTVILADKIKHHEFVRSLKPLIA